MAAALSSVDALSDDDCSFTKPNDASASASKPVPSAKRLPAKKRLVLKFQKPTRNDARSLRYKVDGQCGCLCQCFVPFRDQQVFAKLVQEHRTLDLMDKLEQDKHVSSSA